MIKHLALIMDGNRRWARLRGFRALYGHKEGVQSVKRAVEFCLDKGIRYLSLYTLSLENLKNRSHAEQSYLFHLMASEAKEYSKLFLEHDVKGTIIGDRSLFPDAVKESIQEIEQATKDGKSLQVNFLFCYGARQEIVEGVKTLLARFKKGEITEEQIDEQLFSDCLWTQGIPEPELIMRTGGAQRLSNFLLYQAAYTEIRFLDCFWPELTREHLEQGFQSFFASKQNFGA
jgi:undecaprenyl diphosphate synthase